MVIEACTSSPIWVEGCTEAGIESQREMKIHFRNITSVD